MDFSFNSRRSNVLTTKGCVAANQPLAARAGIGILEKGGNAADAAVATAAALAVTEPVSGGLGGDAFCIFYNATDKTITGLNGSGHSPAALTLDLLTSRGFDTTHPIPNDHGLSVTVPGSAAAWIDTVRNFGSGQVPLSEILNPAIELADNGFPVTEVVARLWSVAEPLLNKSRFGEELLLNGKAPQLGAVMSNPFMAQTLRELLAGGKEGFYSGRIAAAIVEEVRMGGGVMDLSDLANHTSSIVQPINTTYKGVRLWEMPPNSQGIAAIEALNILEAFDLKGLGHNSVDYIHLLIEAFKLSLVDAIAYVADPEKTSVPVEALISKSYAEQRRQLISPDKAMEIYLPGDLPSGGDTTYISVVDDSGNACSFITSNCKGVGTGLVPKNCGFSLHNRGQGFTLRSGHPNAPAPTKRPYHTNMPAMLTSADGSFLSSFGIIGAFMQPQAHVQVLLNMVEFGMSPQVALDQARLCVNIPSQYPGPSMGPTLLEDGIPASHVTALNSMGHQTSGPVKGYDRKIFGRGHIISRNAWWNSSNTSSGHVLWAGSDPRADGCALIW